jgi:RNA polymerase sigma-54 factor
MAKHPLWNDDYWLLLLQLYQKKPMGVKPLYSKGIVDLSLELHIQPEYLHAQMFKLQRITPRIKRLWDKYADNPRLLSRDIKILRSMNGCGNAKDFFAGVEVKESLDDDGLLRKDLDSISDELMIYHNIDVTEKEIEHVLHVLQSFDPAGVGGRSLQECLLLQVKRMPKGVLRKTMEEVFTDYFDEFTKKHWDKIKAGLELNDTQLDTLQREIRKLNPKPGASMGETEGRNIQQITPDFIVDTNDDGSITFSLNRGHIPELTISPSFTDMIEQYRNHKDKMSRAEKEALFYAKGKVDKAQGFIEAIKQRQHTLIVTMKAIIDIQRQFFLDGDEADLKPMILKDVAERTGLDISTISRVSNVKYAQTKWGIFPLKFFFTDGYTTEDGEELSTRKIKIALQEIIAHEDKKKPLSDEALSKALKEKGFPIARRTVAKYREQFNIPVARLRK